MATILIAVQDGKPITSAASLDELFKTTDEYFGACDQYKHSAKRISWELYASKYGGDDFCGTLIYQESEEPSPTTILVYELSIYQSK